MEKTTVLDTSDGIAFFQLATLKSALKLELLGMRHSRGSALKVAKRMGYKGNRETVYKAVCDEVDKRLAAKAQS